MAADWDKGLQTLETSGLHATVIDRFQKELLIVFLKRLLTQTAGDTEVTIPYEEVDNTRGDLFMFRIDENKVFHFEIRRAQ